MKKTTLSKIFGVAVVIALLASLFVAAVPTGALSSIKVVPDSTIISDSTYYTVTMYGSANLDADTDTITVTFPDDTDITGLGDGTYDPDDTGSPIDANIYFKNGAGDNGTATIDADNTDLDARVVTFYVPEDADTGYKWTIIFGYDGSDESTPITNPSEAGTYTIEVYTSLETDAVTSSSYTMGNPQSVEIYNASGNLVKSLDSLTTALESSSLKDYYTIQLGEGDYDIAADNVTLEDNYVTIESTGSASATIIRGLVISGTNNSLNNLTFEDYSSAYNVALTLEDTAESTSIENCAFTKYGSGWTSILLLNNAFDLTVETCTFDTSLGSVKDTAISMANEDATISVSSCTFTLDQSSSYKGDYGIAANAALAGTGNSPSSSIFVSGSTFTGTGGIGYFDASGADFVTFKGNTFDAIESAAVFTDADAEHVTIDGNTISNLIFNSSASYKAGVYISAAAGVTIIENTFQDNLGYSVFITKSGAAENVIVIGNSFINNTKGMANNDTSNSLLAPFNWWNSVDGPTTSTIAGGDTIASSKNTIKGGDNTSTYWFLTVAPTNAGLATVDSSDYEATLKQSAGNFVTVANYTGEDDTDWVSGIKLSGKPSDTVEPDYPSIAYYDIFTTTASATDLTVKLFATGLDDTTQAYYWSGSSGNWELCSKQTTAANGTYVSITVKSAESGTSLDDTSPMATDLTGTVFVLVSGVAPAAESFDVESPELGSTTTLTNIPFSWDPISGATSYAFVLSANADLSSPVSSQPNLTGTAFTYTGTLTAGPYYWQVIAYRNNAQVGKSVTGTFIAAAPVVVASTTAAPVVTITSVPAPTITITQPAPTTITIPQPAVEEITPAWIWGIVGIGAILIIVVIVLIVRTRRSV